MVVRVVRLGSQRVNGEGTRIGTVRRPPRGVPKAAFATQNWYDVWFPNLAPSVDTMKSGQAATTPREWLAFLKQVTAHNFSLELQPLDRQINERHLRTIWNYRTKDINSLDVHRYLNVCQSAKTAGRPDRVSSPS